MKINIERLMSNINEYARYGEDPKGGVTRPSFSQEDYSIRNRFISELQKINLEVSIDAIANIWGYYAKSQTNKKPILIGSHLDTVPNGGAYDGALGVLVAKEVIQTIHEYNVDLNHPLCIVSFTAEEPNDFNLSTMGSRAFLGKLSKEALKSATDSTGRTLKEAVEKAGGNLDSISPLEKEFSAFVELHIEQGKRLEKANIPIGVVDSIVGIYRDKIIINGEANHAGTTMMEDRTDALNTASEIVNEIEEILKKNDTKAVATVGKFNVYPNAPNIIPGKVEFILEIRSESEKERNNLLNNIYVNIKKISERRKTTFTTENILNQSEKKFDKDIIESLATTAKEMKVPYTIFPSMAGHDATHLSEITKTAMLFVKSVGGISHSPDEFTKQKDIETSANVMLQAVLNLDNKLN